MLVVGGRCNESVCVLQSDRSPVHTDIIYGYKIFLSCDELSGATLLVTFRGAGQYH